MGLVIINNKLNIIILPCDFNFYLSDEFSLTSDIQNRIKFIVKKRRFCNFCDKR